MGGYRCPGVNEVQVRAKPSGLSFVTPIDGRTGRISQTRRTRPRLCVLSSSVVVRCTRLDRLATTGSKLDGPTMFSERLLAIFAMMAAHKRSGGERGILCSVAKEVTGVDATSIALSIDDASLIGYCASDAMARSLVDLEITVGEGPCSQAVLTDSVVTCADLRAPGVDWMLFTPEAVGLGARSLVAVPIRIGVIRYGALCFYNVEPGELSDEQSADILLMATVVGRGIVALQAGVEPETLSEELQSEAAFDFSVHQAAGMVAVQASISISNALVSLRMHAFALSEAIADVAARVIARELHFDPRIQEWIET